MKTCAKLFLCAALLTLPAAALADILPDRFEPNDTLQTATYAGVGPGVTLPELTIDNPADADCFQFTVLRTVDIMLTVSFEHEQGDLNVEVFDEEGTPIAAGESEDDNETVELLDLQPGDYHVRIYGVNGAANTYSLALAAHPDADARVFYVNDTHTENTYYTTAPGNAANTGLTPDSPKATIAQILDAYQVTPADIIVIDTGAYSATASITAADEGAIYAGSPGGTYFTSTGTCFDVNDADYNIFHALCFSASGGTGIYLRGSTANRSSNNTITQCAFTGTSTAIRIDAGENNIIASNTISGSGTYGVYITGSAHAIITANSITGRTEGIRASGTPHINANTISGITRGIYITGDALVTANTVTSSQTGIYSTTANASIIHSNHVYANTTGIDSRGIIGSTDWSQANDIHSNTAAGIRADNNATVRFNKIHNNHTGIIARSSTIIHNNLIYRNTAYGIIAEGASNTTITNNTIYCPAGDGIRIRNSSSGFSLQNNIICVHNGYAIYIATDSQTNFASDYNNLYATAPAAAAWWQKPFTDLFDWQVEAGFDGNSIGSTSLHPTLDSPQFVDVDADSLGIGRVERMFRVHKGADTSLCLFLGNDVERQSRLARTLGPVDLYDAAAGYAPHAQRNIQTKAAGWDGFNHQLSGVAQLHYGAIAKSFMQAGKCRL